MKKIFALLLIVCAPSVAFAQIDKREYANWSDYPQVLDFIEEKTFSHCTASCVADDLVVTARHCVPIIDDTGNIAHLFNYKGISARARLISYGSGGLSSRTDDVPGDWAIFRVIDSDICRGNYLNASKDIANVPDAVRVGFAGLKILTDDEIAIVRSVMKKYNMNVSDLINTLLSDIKNELEEKGIVLRDESKNPLIVNGHIFYANNLKISRNCKISEQKNFLQTECSSYPGDSGGPLLKQNDVFGVASIGLYHQDYVNLFNVYNTMYAPVKNFYAELEKAKRESPVVSVVKPEDDDKKRQEEALKKGSDNLIAFLDKNQNKSEEDEFFPPVPEIEDILQIETEKRLKSATDETSAFFKKSQSVATVGDDEQVVSTESIAQIEETDEAIAFWQERQNTLQEGVAKAITNIDSIDDKKIIETLGNMAEYEENNHRLQELKKRADEAKAKEQSTANKMLGAAAIGATGIGGMMALSALGEQRADKSAEQDMAAYLQTFSCNYNGGNRHKLGEMNIELPGGDDMLPLYAEYVALANDLKERKNALGMMPGIESEAILDSATTGLYDDVGTGIAGGAYVSLSRAMMDPEGADAAAWAEQKNSTSKKLKTGAIVAGVGAIGGAIGNILINRKKTNLPVSDLKTAIVNKTPQTPPKCPSGSNGTYPECKCTGNNIHNPNTNQCEPCPGNQVAVDGKCECPKDKPYWDSGAKTCKTAQEINPNNNCTPQCTPTDGSHLLVLQNCECSCSDGYTYAESSKSCECQSPKTVNDKGECVEKPSASEGTSSITNILSNTKVELATLPADAMFAIGKYELLPQAQNAIDEWRAKLPADAESCDVTIVGYTDPVGSDASNMTLSKNRANTVKDYLTKTDKPKFNVTAEGKGENNCHCGIGEFDQSKANTADYANCKNASDRQNEKPIYGNMRYAPCRRIEISGTCTIKTQNSTTVTE